MHFSFSSHPRLLIGLSLVILLSLGGLILARHILLDGGKDTPPHEHPSKTHPSAPVLPTIPAPKPFEKEAKSTSSPVDHFEPLKEIPIGTETNPSLFLESFPFQVKARALPPIQAAPDEGEVEEFMPEIEPEPIEDETTEPEPPIAVPPEPSPDFVR